MHRSSIVVASLMMISSAAAADMVPSSAGEATTPGLSGYGELYLGGLRFAGDDYTTRAGGGAIRVNVPLARRWNIQGDVSYDRVWGHYAPLDDTRGTIHAYYREPESFAAGIFASHTSFGESGVTVNNYAVGPEAQLYLGNLTLYGQGSVGQLTINDFHGGQWGVRAVARYFVHKNFRLDGEVAFNRTDYGIDEDVFGAAIQAMYRFDETPWSIFGRYQFESTRVETFGEQSRTNKLVIGLRASFGSGSLFDEDRNGATMDTYRPASVINTK